MSQETNTAKDAAKPTEQPLPKNIPIELIPLYDWWKASGSQFLTSLITLLVVVGGAFAFMQYRTAKIASANKELLQASSLEDLESVVGKYGSTKAGNAARLRLAKAYFDASRYEEALNAYDTCLSKGAPIGFAEIAKLGRAHALEGLKKLDDALAAYQAFDKESAGHFLQPQAQMGIARVYALQGKKDEAKKLLENLKAKKTDNPTWEMAIANLEGVINRYEPRAERSLFDSANDAAKAIGKPAGIPVTVPAPVVAPATPAAPAPAPATK